MNNLNLMFLKPFIDGTIHTLEVQTRNKPVTGKPFLKSPTANGLSIDIAGTISIWTDAFRGTIFICFPADTYLKIMGNMLGEVYTTIDPEIEDGAGEIMNMIFGFAKTRLNEMGHSLQMTLPGVVVGANIRVKQNPRNPVIILPFNSELGQFQLEIAFED